MILGCPRAKQGLFHTKYGEEGGIILWALLTVFLVWTVFWGEWCGPWASCWWEGGRGRERRGVFSLFLENLKRFHLWFKIFMFSIKVSLNKLQWNFVNIESLKNTYHLILHHLDKFRLVLGKSVLHDTCIWYAKFYWNVHIQLVPEKKDKTVPMGLKKSFQ